MKKLCWQIEGEFITNLARTWFWDEGRSYKDSEELILACLSSSLSTEISKSIALDIIEGRKKFVGVNCFDLVDDGKRVRFITEKLQECQKQLAIKDIEERIRYNGIEFVDPYSTVKSLKEAKLHNVRTADECEIWFLYSDNDQRKVISGEYCDILPGAKKPTKAGLWLFDRPDLIYKASNENKISSLSEEFWKNIYELTKDDKDYRERNNYYLASIRMQQEKAEYYNRLWETWVEEADKIDVTPYPYLSNEWFDATYKNEKDYSYLIVPDNIDRWEGLIDPRGNFYSCEFGGHAVKAYYLIITQHLCDDIDRIDMEQALDYIINKGWCATRYLPTTGSYIEYPSISSGKRVTKAQIDKIFDAIYKHDVRPHNLDEII